MESILASVLVLGDVRSDAIDGEGTILDPIGITANHSTEVGVVGGVILDIALVIVVADDNVSWVTVAIGNGQ